MHPVRRRPVPHLSTAIAMRTVPALLLAVLVSAGASAQVVDPFDVSLPPEFEEAAVTDLSEAHRVGVFMDTTAHRMVVVRTVRDLSWLERQTFRRGWRIGESNRSLDYARIDAETLPLSGRLAEAATSAFAVTGERPHDAGIVVRGCDAAVCFELTVGGLNGSAVTRPLGHADLLAGIRLR